MNQTINPLKLEVLIECGKPVEIIDVRTPEEYEEVHAAGARLVPVAELSPATVLAARELPADQPLYIMCREKERAEKAAELFHNAGYENTVIVQGGIKDWTRFGLPVVRGLKQRRISRQRTFVFVALLITFAFGLALLNKQFLLDIALIVLAAVVLFHHHSRTATQSRTLESPP